MTATGLNVCRESCVKTEDCNGFVWTKEDCELKTGDVKISGDMAGVWSGVMPCP
jgi:hypothetical protein